MIVLFWNIFLQEPRNGFDTHPFCVVCSVSLSNDAKKPSKLTKYLHIKHAYLTYKPVKYFQNFSDS